LLAPPLTLLIANEGDIAMRPLSILIVTLSLLAAGPSFAGKACEELKGEIAAKLDAKGVKGYTLEILPADAASERKEVGRCEGGTKKIVYSRS